VKAIIAKSVAAVIDEKQEVKILSRSLKIGEASELCDMSVVIRAAFRMICVR
jgi:hypothetical protein